MASMSSETRNRLESAILYTAEETHWVGIRLSCEHRLKQGKVFRQFVTRPFQTPPPPPPVSTARFLSSPGYSTAILTQHSPLRCKVSSIRVKKQNTKFPTPAQHPNTGKESHVLFKGLARSFTVCLTFNVCLFLPSFQNLNGSTKPTRRAKPNAWKEII